MKTYYAIKVNGVILPRKCLSRMVAEDEIKHLPVDQQFIAEVVVVTEDGKELLLG